MSPHFGTAAFRTALIGVVVTASMSLAGCGDKPAATPDETPTPSGEATVAIDHYDCPVDGYTIPALAIGDVMDIGGNGQYYEAVCFTVESQTTVNALAYPLEGDQAQTVQIFRLDPAIGVTIPVDITSQYRVDPAANDLRGESLVFFAGAYGLLPYTSDDLEPGTYLLAVLPTNDAELVPTRLAVFADGADHHDEFLASGNPWVVEQATRGTATCSPEGYNIHTQALGWIVVDDPSDKEWVLRCFTLDEPTTITAMAAPVDGEQDLALEILSLSPGGQSTLQDVFDQYRADPSAPTVVFDSVLSADDEIGVLPWGMVDLPAGYYIVAVTPFEAVPLEAYTLFLASDGGDYIDDFFGGSDNPFVIDQYNSYLDGGGTGD